MDQAAFEAVDKYVAERLIRGEDWQEGVLAANAAAGLPAIDVSPAQGRLLALLARMTGARRVLEVGTLGGFSTIWMARALPNGGEVVTLEYAARHAEVARANFLRTGVQGKVTLHVGPAADSLPRLKGPFDLVFIDADKPGNPLYLDWAVRLARPGTMIVLDNVVRDGKILDAASEDASVQGSRAAFDAIAANPRLTATAIQTVGAKGWDGFAVMVVD